jgi:hypothetical protein
MTAPEAAVLALRNPITDIVGCCARATSGQAAAPLPLYFLVQNTEDRWHITETKRIVSSLDDLTIGMHCFASLQLFISPSPFECDRRYIPMWAEGQTLFNARL